MTRRWHQCALSCASCSSPRSRPPIRMPACRHVFRHRRNPDGSSSLPPARPRAPWRLVAERHYLDQLQFPLNRLGGVAVARHGYGRPTRRMTMIEAGHPIPDAAGLAAAEHALEFAGIAESDDLVLVLLSGGASANWIAPAAGDLARREAGGDARTAALGRQHRRNQHGPKASLAHQGRAACVSRAAGARRYARDLRRAGRPPCGDRLGPHGGRPLLARGRAFRRGAVSS